ncbi:hypothetical protein C6W88_05620 [Halomonas litopenaei]|uniref:Uncharacterized protein n=1 Tax=Halomonas litopenaei TaxID=2109328 RepID=A0ABX5IY95_9GAMM|nr:MULTISPECIES: hypothetical protein [Halomonas]PTL90142.1 hypothetical protein C6W89_14340 [Halomonas sp. SYSU XM8]PTL95552.1 hypothetical protein C6W88_05620 [Halomonas litopenaei]
MRSKLYSLKEWFTLEDVASHLTAVFSEKVTVADILQLALQKRIKLSVNLISSAEANKGTVHDITEGRVILHPAETPLSWLRGDEPKTSLEKKLRAVGVVKIGDIQNLDEEIRNAVKDQSVHATHLGEIISETDIVEFEKEVQSISGIYDLPMLSAEKSLIEEMYYPKVGGPDIDTWGLEGLWLERGGHIYRLCERVATQADHEACGNESSFAQWERRYRDPSRWFPTTKLPEESTIIVSRVNLDAFIDGLEEPQSKVSVEANGDESRVQEVLGLLVEMYAGRHGPDFHYGTKPKASRIVQDMLSAVPDGITGMGDRKLKEHVSAAIAAWEAKKRR